RPRAGDGLQHRDGLHVESASVGGSGDIHAEMILLRAGLQQLSRLLIALRVEAEEVAAFVENAEAALGAHQPAFAGVSVGICLGLGGALGIDYGNVAPV